MGEGVADGTVAVACKLISTWSTTSVDMYSSSSWACSLASYCVYDCSDDDDGVVDGTGPVTGRLGENVGTSPVTDEEAGNVGVDVDAGLGVGREGDA